MAFPIPFFWVSKELPLRGLRSHSSAVRASAPEPSPLGSSSLQLGWAAWWEAGQYHGKSRLWLHPHQLVRLLSLSSHQASVWRTSGPD